MWPPAPLRPTDLGFTPEEAAKIGPPVLVEPPTPPSRPYRYRWYAIENNHCEQDLEKLLQVRTQTGATGPVPYCTDNPIAPENKGSAFVFESALG